MLVLSNVFVGSSANDGTGTPLRNAFQIIDQNFANILQDDISPNSVNSVAGRTGNVVLTVNDVAGAASIGFVNSVTGVAVYYGDANVAAYLPTYGGHIKSNVVGNGPDSMVSFVNFPSTTGTMDIVNNAGPVHIVSDQFNQQVWDFGTDGSLVAPSLLPTTFTAILDSSHCITGLSLNNDPWEYPVTFNVLANGTVETLIDSNLIWLNNPGYTDGVIFIFGETDHGIPGYTLVLTLLTIVDAGPAGWGANLGVNQGPTYPSTFKSYTPVKFSANTFSWILGTDGTLTLPIDGDINYANGQSILDGIAGSGSTLINGSQTVTLDTTGRLNIPANGIGINANTFNLFYDGGTVVFSKDNLVTSIYDGVNFNSIGNLVAQTTLQASNYVISFPGNTWTFDNAGGLTFPNSGTQTIAYTHSDLASYLPTDTTIIDIQANVGAFETYANLTFGTNGYNDASVAAYLVSHPIAALDDGTGSTVSFEPTTGNVLLTVANAQVANIGTEQFAIAGDLSVAGRSILTGDIFQTGAYYETFSNVANSSSNLTLDITQGGVFYAPELTSDVTADFINVNPIGGTATGATIIIDQTSNPYVINSVTVNGTPVSILWNNSVAPTGSANKTDIMSFSLLCLDGVAYRVLGQLTTYG